MSEDITARNVLSDLHAVIKMLRGSKDSSSLSHSPSVKVDEDKENRPILETAVRHATTIQDLNSRDAVKYYRRYRDLTQGLDTMTRERKLSVRILKLIFCCTNLFPANEFDCAVSNSSKQNMPKGPFTP